MDKKGEITVEQITESIETAKRRGQEIREALEAGGFLNPDYANILGTCLTGDSDKTFTWDEIRKIMGEKFAKQEEHARNDPLPLK